MFKIGPKTRKGAGSFLTEASADDPIYRRGFAIGGLHSTPSSKATAQSESPNSNNQEPSSGLPPFEVEAHRSLEESLLRRFARNTEPPLTEENPSSESTTPETPENLSPDTSTDQE